MIIYNTLSAKILDLSLRESAKILSQYKDSRSSLDNYLSSFFLRKRKRYGKRDRTIIRDILFAFMRQRLRAAKLCEFICSKSQYIQDSNLHLLVSLLLEHRMNQKELRLLLDKNHFDTKIISELMRHYDKLVSDALPTNCEHLTRRETISVRYSFPQHSVDRWITSFGLEATEELCRFLNERAPLNIRVNMLKTSPHTLARHLNKYGFIAKPCTHSPTGLHVYGDRSLYNTKEYQQGWFEVQDEGSQLISFIINPPSGVRLWDVCAGSGGKSIHLADLTANKSYIMATDIDRFKIAALKKRLSRISINSIDTKFIGATLPQSIIRAPVDILIIDAPCTGTGRLRRNPEQRWQITPDSIQKQSNMNVQLLLKYAPYVSNGGKLFYITCSLEKEENEGVITEFLARAKTFRLTQFNPHPSVSLKIESSTFLLHPVKFKTDGFFIASLERRDN